MWLTGCYGIYKHYLGSYIKFVTDTNHLNCVLTERWDGMRMEIMVWFVFAFIFFQRWFYCLSVQILPLSLENFNLFDLINFYWFVIIIIVSSTIYVALKSELVGFWCEKITLKASVHHLKKF